MEGTNPNPAMTRFAVQAGLLGEEFTLIDVGCSGGIQPHWRAFGERLRAFGFDPQRQECVRLNQRETNPRVRYFPYFVGLDPDHWFHRRRPAKGSPEARYFQVCLPQLSAGFALECSRDVRPQDNPLNEDLTSDRIGVSRFVREQAVGDVDFVKIDTDGGDLEVLLSCEEAIRNGSVLGFMVESPFTGSGHETDNSFHNIDRFMRQHGYCLYSLTVNRYSRRALPAPFKIPIAAQTETGQAMWGDAIYFRNAASPQFESLVGKLDFEKLLKLACLYEIFALNDCAAELIQQHRALFAARTEPDRLLDLLTPPLHGTTYSYADYINLFREDVSRFFPGGSPPPASGLRALARKFPRLAKGAKAVLRPSVRLMRRAAAVGVRVARRVGTTTGVNKLRGAWQLLKNPNHLYGWWWWYSPNRPHIQDDSYRKLLAEVPENSRGMDLGSGAQRVRKDALTVDSNPDSGADVICDGAALPFPDGHFDYVWCNAMLEHVPHPHRVAAEIVRTLKPGGLAFVQVPFLENVHSWPEDYYRFTVQGLRVLFRGLEEVKSGAHAGPGQVLPDLLQYYATGFAEIQNGGLLVNLWCIAVGFWLVPLRWLDRLLQRRPSHWKWARAYYYVGRKPAAAVAQAA